MPRNFDALLDAYARVLRAMLVLHYEAETDLDFDAFVEMANVRYDAAARTFDLDVEALKPTCPEEGCEGEYVRVGMAYIGGRDHDGRIVWMEKWQCQDVPKHWHTREVRDGGE